MILSFALISCEEEDSPLLFSTVENTFPENVKLEYYSPDPSCIARSYHISTNRMSGVLILKCTNSNKLFFTKSAENSRGQFGVTDTGETDYNTLVFEKGNWTVTIMDDNHLKFVFKETPVTPDMDFVFENDYVNIKGYKCNRVTETSIDVWRSLND